MLIQSTRLTRPILLGLCVAGITVHARADEIQLTSGITKEGIIESETEEMVRLRTDVGTTGISRSFIVEIHHATDEQNAALEREWAADADARQEWREEGIEADRRFADEQRAKGLVMYEKKWVTKAEADLLLQTRGQDLAAKNDRRITELEAERDAARHSVDALQKQIAQLKAERDESDEAVEHLEVKVRDLEYDLNEARSNWADALRLYRRCQSTLSSTP